MVTEGNYTYCDEHFIMFIIVDSLCCTPETNILLYVNYTSLLKNEKLRFRLLVMKGMSPG